MSLVHETLEALRKLGPEKVLDGMELCPSCDSLSPCIAMDGETVMHCPACHDQGMVTVEAATAVGRQCGNYTACGNGRPTLPIAVKPLFHRSFILSFYYDSITA